MGVRFHDRIDDIPAAEWDELHDGANPLLRHAFLKTLEDCGAAKPGNGWIPHHLGLYENGRLAGAVPLYRKTNSWGEFVFDWSWAEAYHRAGLPYFPKLVAGVPFSPVTGPRLLTAPGGDPAAVSRRLARSLVGELESLGDSTLHVNFVDERDAGALEATGLLPRSDVQFHWVNRGYSGFDEFLSELSHKRRKNIRRERRDVREAGVTFELVDGTGARDWHWKLMHSLYADTFLRHLSRPALNLECFVELGRKLGKSALLILARRGGAPIAGAFFLVGADTLYGRYWGCRERVPGLHFETCYYRGIEHCIENGLSRFEPGAQGEHKLLRGFEPVLTRSYHWVRNQAFRDAIARSLEEERRLVHWHRDSLAVHAALKRGVK